MTETRKFNRPSWDWSGMEPDKPVTFTIMFDRNEKDDGVKQNEETGELREWHRMVCKVNGADHTVFSQNDQMYDDWMTLDLNHKGQEFTVTKKAVWNKETKKFKTIYEIQSEGTVLEKAKPEPPESTSPKSTLPSLGNHEKLSFEEVALPIWSTVWEYCFEGTEEPSLELRPQFRLEIVKACSTMVNTAVIQNGGKR